jgi:hypothetical protein
MSTRWLHAIVFGLIAVAGVLLLRRPVTERIIAASVLLALLVLLGVFLPTLARAILNQILWLAVLLVLLLWGVVFLVRGLPKLAQLKIRWPRRKRTKSADPSPPAESLPAKPATDESPPAGPASDQQPPPASAEGPSEEGGPSHES